MSARLSCAFWWRCWVDWFDRCDRCQLTTYSRTSWDSFDLVYYVNGLTVKVLTKSILFVFLWNQRLHWRHSRQLIKIRKHCIRAHLFISCLHTSMFETIYLTSNLNVRHLKIAEFTTQQFTVQVHVQNYEIWFVAYVWMCILTYPAGAGSSNLWELNNIMVTTFPRTVPCAGIGPSKWLVIQVILAFHQTLHSGFICID